MAGIAYGSRGGRLRVTKTRGKASPARPVEEVVREIKAAQTSSEADYRERSLAIHGLICGRCGREFDAGHRHLLTVHHKDGNHHNNPPDGSNWENLCVYCHEDEHSRGVLADYVAEAGETGDAPADVPPATGFGTLAAALARHKDGKK